MYSVRNGSQTTVFASSLFKFSACKYCSFDIPRFSLCFCLLVGLFCFGLGFFLCFLFLSDYRLWHLLVSQCLYLRRLAAAGWLLLAAAGCCWLLLAAAAAVACCSVQLRRTEEEEAA